MTTCCNHCRFRIGVDTIGRIFWILVVFAAGFCLIIALEMLRRSGCAPEGKWEREAEPEGRAPIAVANDNPSGGR